MSSKKHLTGITWDHSRGYSPMVATSQRFNEITETNITWEKRTLQDFADKPINKLVEIFDLLIIDHPWIGFAAEKKLFVPLDQYLPNEYLDDLERNTVGQSYSSYQHNNHLWALPIDAATPVASYRKDILSMHNEDLPKDFSELLALAQKGLVIFPIIAIDTLMNFFMLCATLGENPFSNENEVISSAIGTEALHLLKELANTVDKRCFEWNPIKVYEVLSNTDEFAYCPFAYGYSNYAKEGFAKNKLAFADLIQLKAEKLKSTIGGTGIAISTNCSNLDAAMQFVQYVASPTIQQHLYFDSGGQPAHFASWQNKYCNKVTDNFFSATLPALERAYLRPRYNGFIYFQDRAGDIIRDYLMKGGNTNAVLEKLNNLYHKSKL
ncbi:MAG TPA: extracellular solute-binding protein [Arachidicoccus soli]|nr:extracellular solute-binding protein [Arachidicoccus soli]